jgi:hypothetical protein
MEPRMMIIARRTFLRGLLAAPAVVAVGNLMPIRGIVMPIRHLVDAKHLVFLPFNGNQINIKWRLGDYDTWKRIRDVPIGQRHGEPVS